MAIPRLLPLALVLAVAGAVYETGGKRCPANASTAGCVDFRSAQHMREVHELLVREDALSIERSFADAKKLTAAGRLACPYVESCDPEVNDPAWSSVAWVQSFNNPDTGTCSRRDWGNMSNSKMLRTAVTGRQATANATDAMCSGWPALVGPDGLTKNAELTNEYYARKGCFSSSIKAKCMVNREAYGINLPTGMQVQDYPRVQEEICATNGRAAEYMAHHHKYPQLHQHFAGMQETGLYRSWPLIYQCRTEAQCSGCSDPRFRGWYASSVSGPKDVVLVLDRSGSMNNEDRMAKVREAAGWVINTLSYVDYATVVKFGTGVESLDESLMPMHMINRKRMKQFVAETGAFGGTRLDEGFREAFEVLNRSTQSGHSSNCEKVILFLTDGVNTGKDPAENESDVKGKALMRRIACQNNGVYFNVPKANTTDPDYRPGGGLKLTMASYFKYLAAGTIPATGLETTVRWTERFEDGQGTGQTDAACAPIYDRSGQTADLLGVTCIAAFPQFLDQWDDSDVVMASTKADAATCATSRPLTKEFMDNIRRSVGGDAVCPASFPEAPPDGADGAKVALDGGAIAGIAVGASVGLVALLALGYLIGRRRSCLVEQAPMILVIVSLLAGISAIAAMSYTSGTASLNKMIGALVDQTTKNVVLSFEGAISTAVMANFHTVAAVRRGEVPTGAESGTTRHVLMYLRGLAGIFRGVPSQYIATLDTKLGAATFLWAYPDPSQLNITDADGKPVHFRYAVMDRSTVDNASGKRCICWNYEITEHLDSDEDGTCSGPLDCTYNPTKRGWFIKAQKLQGHIAFSDPYKDWSVSKALMISPAAMLTQPGRNGIITVVGNDLKLDDFSPILDTLRNRTFETPLDAKTTAAAAVAAAAGGGDGGGGGDHNQHSEQPPNECARSGDKTVNILFALGDRTVVASTNKTVNEQVLIKSGDYRATDTVENAMDRMKTNDDKPSFISGPGMEADGSGPSVDVNYIVSGQRFGAKYFGDDGFILITIPYERYYGFILDAVVVSLASAGVGIVCLVFVAWWLSKSKSKSKSGSGDTERGALSSGKPTPRRGKPSLVTRGASLKDIRAGKHLLDDAQRLKLLRLMLEGVNEGFGSKTIILSAVLLFMAAILFGNFLVWNSMFQDAITRVVEATMVQIDITATFELGRTFDQTKEVGELILLGAASGYLKLGPETTAKDGGKADTFFSDLHHLYRNTLKPSMLYAATVATADSFNVDGTPSSSSFRGVAARHARRHDFSGTMVLNNVVQTGPGLNLRSPLSQTPIDLGPVAPIPEWPSAAVARSGGSGNTTMPFMYTPPPGQPDPREEPWYNNLIEEPAAQQSRPQSKLIYPPLTLHTQWSKPHTMHAVSVPGTGPSTGGVGLTTAAPMVGMRNFPHFGDLPTVDTEEGRTVMVPSVPNGTRAMVDVDMRSISDRLRLITFFPSDDEGNPSGVVFVVDRANAEVMASSEMPSPIDGSVRSEGVSAVLPTGGTLDPSIRFVFSELQLRRGDVKGMTTARTIKKFETSRFTADPSKQFDVMVSRIGPPTLSKCSIRAGGDNVDWLLVVALDKRAFFADYDKRAEMSLIVALGAVFLSMTLAVTGLSTQLDKYVRRTRKVADPAAQERVDELRDMEPGSEEFFATCKALLEPSVYRANIIQRAAHDSELPPPLVDLSLYDAIYQSMAENRSIWSRPAPRRSSTTQFETVDTDANGELTLEEFKLFVRELPGHFATMHDVEVLFRTLDADHSGTITREEFSLPPPARTAVDTVSTIDERKRALEYIVLSDRGYNILEMLNYETALAHQKKRLYLVYGSRLYTGMMAIVLFAHLGLSFLEAPAGRVGLRATTFDGSTWTRPNATTLAATHGVDVEEQIDRILIMGGVLILLQFIDMAVSIAVYGFFVPMSAEQTEQVHQQRLEAVKQQRARSKSQATSRRGTQSSDRASSGGCGGLGCRALCDRTSWSACLAPWLQRREPRTIVLVHLVLLVAVLVDWVVQLTTRYRSVDEADAVLALPWTALLRPFIFMSRFEGVGDAATNLVKTLFFGMDVLALFLSMVVISATMGITLLSGQNDGGQFESVPEAVISVFIFLLTGENHPDIVYGPTSCPESSHPMNDLLGGVSSGGCSAWVLHPIFMVFEFLGLFLIVALVIAVFESFYGNRTQGAALTARKSRRLGIIAAFSLLDKSGDGALDRVELLDFLNDTAGLNFEFVMSPPDLELNGIEFVEVAEHLVRQMSTRIPEPRQDTLSLRGPRNSSVSSTTSGIFRRGGGSMMFHAVGSMKPRARGSGDTIAACQLGDLHRFFRERDSEMTPCPPKITTASLAYYRRAAAIAVAKEIKEDTAEGRRASRDRLASAIGSVAGKSLRCSLRRVLRHYFDRYNSFHQLLMMLASFANIWILTLYAHAYGFCKVGGNGGGSNGTDSNGTVGAELHPYDRSYDTLGPDVQGYKLNGCILDIVCFGFNVVWWLDIGARIVARRWANFWRVNDDFYNQLQNRFDFVVALAGLVCIVVGGATHLAGDMDTHPGLLRLAFTIPCFRLLSVTALTREILFSMLAILPTSKNIFLLLLLVIHFYNILGCILFSGKFRFLGEGDYDMPQANFNSFLDGYTTLFQLFVGEAWNGILSAAMQTAYHTTGPWVVVYFFSYTIILTVVFSNLLIGVVISGYSSVYSLRESTGEDNKIPSRHVDDCLLEGSEIQTRIVFDYSTDEDGKLVLTISRKNTPSESESCAGGKDSTGSGGGIRGDDTSDADRGPGGGGGGGGAGSGDDDDGVRGLVARKEAEIDRLRAEVAELMASDKAKGRGSIGGGAASEEEEEEESKAARDDGSGPFGGSGGIGGEMQKGPPSCSYDCGVAPGVLVGIEMGPLRHGAGGGGASEAAVAVAMTQPSGSAVVHYGGGGPQECDPDRDDTSSMSSMVSDSRKESSSSEVADYPGELSANAVYAEAVRDVTPNKLYSEHPGGL